MRRALTFWFALAALLVVGAQPVAAARPHHERFRIVETVPEVLCGIPVTTHAVIKVNVIIRPNRPVIDVTRVNLLHVDVDGDWVAYHVAGAAFVSETVNGDGTVTFVERHAGVQSRLRSSEGLTAVFDRGTITFTTTVDFNDPANPDDDVVVSSSWTYHGPHPEAESGFTLFCEVVTQVLG